MMNNSEGDSLLKSEQTRENQRFTGPLPSLKVSGYIRIPPGNPTYHKQPEEGFLRRHLIQIKSELILRGSDTVPLTRLR